MISVQPGTHLVTVHLAGHAPDLEEVQVEAAKNTVVEAELKPEHVDGGVVMDSDGKPVDGAGIGARR